MLRKIMNVLQRIIYIIYVTLIALLRKVVKTVQRPIKLIRVTNKALKRAKLI